MAASFLSGDVVKMLKDQIEMVSGYRLLFGGSNPTVFAIDAAKGSVYISDSTGDMYLKQDNGSSTNWEPLAKYSTVVTDITNIANNLYSQIERAKGTRLVSSGLATITGAGATVTVPSYKVHIVDHATNSLTVAESTTPVVLTPPDYTTPIWYAYITAANTVQWESQEVSAPANRTLVPIFSVITNGTIIVAVNNGTRGSYRDFNGFIQDYAQANPPRSIEGNVITLTAFTAAGALINKTIGKIFTPGANVPGNASGSEGVITSPQFAPYASIINDMSGAGGVGFINFQSARLSGTSYDLNGVLTNVGNTRYSIRPIYIGRGGLIVSPLGQQVYTSATNAKNALGTDVLRSNPNLKDLLFLGWVICRGNNAEFQFIANANAICGGAPNVSLNLWSTRTLTSADSPFTVTGNKTIYVCDTSAGAIDIVLPLVDSSIASDENRFIKSADAHFVKIYTSGSVQNIGTKPVQYLWERGDAFSVVASDLLYYLITQDNRKDSTFKTPSDTWATTGKLEDVDSASSTFGTGASISGDNHSVTLTTGTTPTTLVFNAVSTQEKIDLVNYFRFYYDASADGGFTAKVQGYNGAWVDLNFTLLDIIAGSNQKALTQFDRTDYTQFRLVVNTLGTTAGRTLTISRGEWTDQFSKIVEVSDESEIVSFVGYTSGTNPVLFKGTIDNTSARLLSPSADRSRVTFLTDCLFFADANTSAASGDKYVQVVQNNAANARVRSSYQDTNATTELGSNAALIGRAKAGDYVYVVSSAGTVDVPETHLNITATPIGKQRGYTATADVDLSQYQYPQYDVTPVSQAGRTDNYSRITPYKTPDGKYRAIVDWKGYWSGAVDSFTLTFSGIVFKSYATVENYQQRAAAGSTPSSDVNSYFDGGTSSCRVFSTPTQANFSVWADVELESWPVWATKKSFVVQNMIAPIAVANYVSAELTGYAGGASGAPGTIQFANATNALPDYLEISASKDRVTFKKALKNVSAYGMYVPTTEVVQDVILRLFASNGVMKRDSYSSGVANASYPQSIGLLFDAEVGDYLLVVKGTSTGTPTNDNRTRLIVKCLDIDSSMIASSTDCVHKYAMVLSSDEISVGTDRRTGKTIYQRSYTWTGSSNAAVVGTIPVGVKAHHIFGTIRVGSLNDHPVGYQDSGGGMVAYIDTGAGAVKISSIGYTMSSADITVQYTKP